MGAEHRTRLQPQQRRASALYDARPAAGIQRVGASMWSGDIGSQLGDLATHANAQMHMSISGIDYFGADIGGFHRDALNSDLGDLYTRWFANGMVFDIPGRPRTTRIPSIPTAESSPRRLQSPALDRIGDKTSNQANVRQRYELSPYTYSLAYRAYLFAEPVAPPLVYYYQNTQTSAKPVTRSFWAAISWSGS